MQCSHLKPFVMPAFELNSQISEDADTALCIDGVEVAIANPQLSKICFPRIAHACKQISCFVEERKCVHGFRMTVIVLRLCHQLVRVGESFSLPRGSACIEPRQLSGVDVVSFT